MLIFFYIMENRIILEDFITNPRLEEYLTLPH